MVTLTTYYTAGYAVVRTFPNRHEAYRWFFIRKAPKWSVV